VRWLHRALIAAGAAAFVWLVAASGPAALLEDAATLGFGAALIAAIALLEHALHALAWARCFAPVSRPGAARLLGAYLAGHAVNLVTPTATLGGEVVRAGLLPPGLPRSEIVASVTADRLAMSLADVAIGLVGFAVLWSRGPFTGWARVAFGAGALLLTAGVAAFLMLQRTGRLASRVAERGAVGRLVGARLSERLRGATREIDRRLAALHLERPGDFRAALLLHAAGTSVGALQLALFLAWLGIPFDAATLVTVFSVGVALDLFSFFVPARLGAQEASRMLAMSVAGLDPARGLLFSLVLRLEQLAWAGVGFVVVPSLLREGAPRPLAPGAAAGEHPAAIPGSPGEGGDTC
jgi:hypothetical protein